MQQRLIAVVVFASACGGGTANVPGDGASTVDAPPGSGTAIGGCTLFPADNIFNTRIDDLPSVHADSDTWVSLIGRDRRIHLDLGTQQDQTRSDYYGIPHNVVRGNSMAWSEVAFMSTDPDLSWDPREEADCASADKRVVSPCTAQPAYLPFTDNQLVEGGLSTAANHLPYADHHVLVVDSDTCRLWEAYHVYRVSGQWQIFGAATFDLRSNAMRTAGWTSADAAGFPILPLVLRADEAATGTIAHALRFTIPSSSIRGEYTWPATHKTGNDPNPGEPPMGQLFRLKASFVIPDSWSTQSKAIAQAMKTYGMYLADGGSSWYVTGAPGDWDDAVFDEVQSITGGEFEAVDLRPILGRAGFDATSMRVPPP